jgi:hypothetical protein
MSSLLNKLKTLIGASARGPRRYATNDDVPRPGTSVASAPREVTDARVSQDDKLEAVEALRVTTSLSRTASSSPEPSPIEEPDPDAAQIEQLEDDRIIDLLKGKQS